MHDLAKWVLGSKIFRSTKVIRLIIEKIKICHQAATVIRAGNGLKQTGEPQELTACGNRGALYWGFSLEGFQRNRCKVRSVYFYSEITMPST